MTHADLFTGIGGFRLALESLGVKCVLSCENNKHAKQTYEQNFPPHPGHLHVDDIKELAQQESLPKVDFVTGGFPCQPFSMAGLRKGRTDLRGTLFWDMAKVIERCQPKMFLLENVPGLRSIGNGETYKSILKTLIVDLGYSTHVKKINSYPLVAQKRPRLFFVGFRKFTMFAFPEHKQVKHPPTIGDIVLPAEKDDLMLTEKQWVACIENKRRFAEKHNTMQSSFFHKVYTADDVSRTITTNVRNSRKVLYQEPGWERPRFFAVREVARMMGFPDHFTFPCPQTYAYEQLGNAVGPAVVRMIVAAMLDTYGVSNAPSA